MKKFFYYATAASMVISSILWTVMLVFILFSLQLASGRIEAQSALNVANAIPTMIFSFGTFIIWQITTSIGLFLKKIWARYSMIVYASFSILIGLFILLVTVSVSMVSFIGPVEPNVTGLVISLLILLTIFIILPIIQIVFLCRRSVKELFYKDGIITKSARPALISVIAILYLFGAISSLFSLVFMTNRGFILFGTYFSGVIGTSYIVITTIIGLYLAFGLWKKHRTAWFVAVAMNLFGFLNSFVSLFLVNTDTLNRVYNEAGGSGIMSSGIFQFGFICVIIIEALFLIYFYYVRNVFLKAEVKINEDSEYAETPLIPVAEETPVMPVAEETPVTTVTEEDISAT